MKALPPSAIYLILISVGLVVPEGSLVQPLIPLEPTARVYAQDTPQSCCKQWDTRYQNWRIVGDDQARCEAWNDRFDNDDINEPQGNIWWDDNCSGAGGP